VNARSSLLPVITVAAVLPLRVLYLARSGPDPRWMNANYLLNAKTLLVGVPQLHGPPMPELLLLGLRRIGLDGVAAIDAVYLLAHVSFAVGIAVLARALWPALPNARSFALVVLTAALPALAGDDGFDNIGVALGAGLLVLTFGLACVATADRPSLVRLIGVAVTAAAACATRNEALLGVTALAALLLVLGGRVEGVRSPRVVATTLIVGAIVSVTVTATLRDLLTGRAELASPTYAFYTFYGGLPRSLCQAPCPSEYSSYAESVRRFGSFDENHGRLALALIRHPGAALLRLGAQLTAWLSCLLDVRGVAVALPLAAFGSLLAWRGRRRDSRLVRRGTLLAAYLAPAAVLYIPPAITEYFLLCLPVVLLAAAFGAGAIASRLPGAVGGAVGALALAAGALGASTGFGHRGPSSPLVIRQVAADLEQRCHAGCLVNYPPPHLAAEAWVDLEAGAPLPAKTIHDERFVFDRPTPELRVRAEFRQRVARARAAGYRGPVLYVAVNTRVPAYSDLGFDRLHEWEGPVDLTHAVLERRFTDAEGEIDLWSFPPEVIP